MAALEAEKKEWRDRLNKAFKEGGFVYDPKILEMIRRADFPIMVDFNNVLASNNKPDVVNPKAKKFLEDLSIIGEVFVVTTARSWERVWKILVDNGLEKNIVLMVTSNYAKSDSELSDAQIKNKNSIIDSYIEKIRALGSAEEFGIADNEDNIRFWKKYKIYPVEGRRLCFSGAPANKRLSPIFDKAFKIPMIDDSYMAVKENPGVAGILAPCFESHPYEWENPEETNAERMTLEQIGEEVRKLKSTSTPRPTPRP